jgi:hypothetical protein
MVLHLPYTGVIAGMPYCTGFDADHVIHTMKGRDFAVSVLALPVPDSAIESICTNIENKRSEYQLIKERHSRGELPQYANNTPLAGVDRLLTVLVSEYERFSTKRAQGFWSTCIRFATTDVESARMLGRCIIGAIKQHTSLMSHPGIVDLSENGEYASVLTMPGILFSSLAYRGARQVAYPTALCDSDSLAALIQLPRQSHQGFTVVDLDRGVSSIVDFDVTPPAAEGDCIDLGLVAGSHQRYLIPIDKLNEHVLVCGLTKSGKTNTVKHILATVHERGIPFLVIEPVKSEYSELVETMPGLKVYTADSQTSPLLLNPLEPERGVYLSAHADSLVEVFNGAYDLEPPLRTALKNLIMYTYRQPGGVLPNSEFSDAVADPDIMLFPTIREMRDLVDRFCAEELSHDTETRSAFRGAMEMRLTNLNLGLIGRITNTQVSTSASELCGGPAVVDLDLLSEDSKAFVTNLLLVKVSQHLRRQRKTQHLANLLVVEEAHNVFTNPQAYQQGQSSKMAATAFFANLLREIRAYGTGVVVVDQRPSMLDSNAIANTATSIVHALQEQQDIDAVSSSLRLSEYQRRRMPVLRRGEAIVSQVGEEQVCKVLVDRSIGLI